MNMYGTDENIKYVIELSHVLTDDTIKDFKGYNPYKGHEESIIIKKDDELWVHSSVYGLLEENEMMDDIMDYFADNKVFSKIIIFDDENKSVIKLDY